MNCVGLKRTPYPPVLWLHCWRFSCSHRNHSPYVCTSHSSCWVNNWSGACMSGVSSCWSGLHKEQYRNVPSHPHINKSVSVKYLYCVYIPFKVWWKGLGSWKFRHSKRHIGEKKNTSLNLRVIQFWISARTIPIQSFCTGYFNIGLNINQ